MQEFTKITNPLNPFCGKSLDETLWLLTHSPKLIQFIKSPTKEMCWAALRKDPHVVRFLCRNGLIDEELAFGAVRLNATVLQYLPAMLHTLPVVLEAVSQRPASIQYTYRRDEEVCLTAARKYGLVLEYIQDNDQTESICIAAVEDQRDAIEFVAPRFMHLFY